MKELQEFCKVHNLGWRIEETDLVRVTIFGRGMSAKSSGVLSFARGPIAEDVIKEALRQARTEKERTK